MMLFISRIKSIGKKKSKEMNVMIKNYKIIQN